MPSHHLQLNNTPQCPNCSKPLDGATNADDNAMLPKDGDVSVCFYCGTMLQFSGKGMNLKTVSLSDEVRMRKLDHLQNEIFRRNNSGKTL